MTCTRGTDEHTCTEPLTTEDPQVEVFLAAWRRFYSAGMDLCNAWQGQDGWHADDAAPLPDAIRPPMSLDEWLMELDAHYLKALKGEE